VAVDSATIWMTLWTSERCDAQCNCTETKAPNAPPTKGRSERSKNGIKFLTIIQFTMIGNRLIVLRSASRLSKSPFWSVPSTLQRPPPLPGPDEWNGDSYHKWRMTGVQLVVQSESVCHLHLPPSPSLTEGGASRRCRSVFSRLDCPESRGIGIRR
jgi:hypothetical protein